MTISLLSPTLQNPSLPTFSRRSLLPLRRDAIWEIQSGVVRTFTWLDNGTIVTFGLWGKGDIVSPLLSKADPFYMECLTDVKADLLSLNSEYSLDKALIAHIQQLNALMEIKHSRPVEDALLKFLLWLGQKFGREVKEGQLIDLRLTHQEIADIIGTTRVTVTRFLKILEQRQVIKRFAHQEILIYEPKWYYQI